MKVSQNFDKCKKSASEKFCKNSFDDFLRNLLPDSVISWACVEQKDEPPDFFLFVDGTKYAVEVTILMQKFDVGTKKPLPLGKIRDELEKFVLDEVKSVARDNNCLHGVYLVTFSKPIDSFTNAKTMIQNKLLTYIRATQGSGNAPGELIYKCGRQTCKITKVHDRDNKVIMGGPGDSKWEREVLADAYQLLDKSIEEKELKLRNISGPKVLLLHDQYIFGTVETYKACIPLISSLVSFHTLFIVGNNSKGLVLYSQDPKWASGLRRHGSALSP
jgi:hypothetical protein